MVLTAPPPLPGQFIPVPSPKGAPSPKSPSPKAGPSPTGIIVPPIPKGGPSPKGVPSPSTPTGVVSPPSPKAGPSPPTGVVSPPSPKAGPSPTGSPAGIAPQPPSTGEKEPSSKSSPSTGKTPAEPPSSKSSPSTGKTPAEPPSSKSSPSTGKTPAEPPSSKSSPSTGKTPAEPPKEVQLTPAEPPSSKSSPSTGKTPAEPPSSKSPDSKSDPQASSFNQQQVSASVLVNANGSIGCTQDQAPVGDRLKDEEKDIPIEFKYSVGVKGKKVPQEIIEKVERNMLLFVATNVLSCGTSPSRSLSGQVKLENTERKSSRKLSGVIHLDPDGIDEVISGECVKKDSKHCALVSGSILAKTNSKYSGETSCTILKLVKTYMENYKINDIDEIESLTYMGSTAETTQFCGSAQQASTAINSLNAEPSKLETWTISMISLSGLMMLCCCCLGYTILRRRQTNDFEDDFDTGDHWNGIKNHDTYDTDDDSLSGGNAPTETDSAEIEDQHLIKTIDVRRCKSLSCNSCGNEKTMKWDQV
eukprot:CAMPEP_0184872192 /NCGR_PEP_ID=MMETSP0580-20130426/41144_1 /TAXON_ID=1118495 /ORGANISM="Dactyliosolen fragilissimus" /LENGTH=529 /DNA_ID=CAMNT_0027374947 /DNA_START=594 /DNA_END=2182 /DNA_ORIENTATION=+